MRLQATLLLAFAIAACGGGDGGGGGGGGGGPGPSGNVVAGDAIKGRFTAGNVTGLAINANGTLGASLGSAAIKADGSFSVDVGSHTGPLALRVQNGTFLDETTGTQAQSSALFAVLPAVGAGVTANVTPLTSIAAGHALKRMSLGGAVDASITDTNTEVGAWFGVGDILTVTPADLAGGPVASVDAAAEYGAILAGISQQALSLAVASDALAAALAEDAADGLFDGMDGAAQVTISGGGNLSPDAAQGELAAAITAFLGSAANLSGLTAGDFTALIDRLNSRVNALLFVTSITVTPANPTIAVNMSIAFSAEGVFSDGSSADVTATVLWDSSDTNIATILQTGVAMAGSSGGSTSISAEQDGAIGNTLLTVTAAALVSIAVTPGNPTLFVNEMQQFTATGTYADNSMVDLTSVVDWTSSNPGVLDVGVTGLATALSAGTATVRAEDPGSMIFGDTGVTVNAVVLVSIAVTPANPSLFIGQSQQFTATGTFNNNTVVNITASVTWQSSSTAVLGMTAGGLGTGLAAGGSVVTATDPGTMISGTTNATVFVSYANNIQPVFNNNCVGCHGGSGGLFLTSYSGVIAGGNSGPAVDPGNATNSLLVKRIEGTIQPQMPMGASPLPPATIQMIRAWIDAGALNN